LPALVVADELGLFSLLERSPASSKGVAEALNISGRGAAAVLGVVTGLGFLRKVNGGYHLTELAREYLLPTSPYYWGGVFQAFRAEPDRHTPEKLLRALCEDAGAQQNRASESWKNGTLSAERAQLITAYMHAHSFPSAVGFARRMELQGVRHLLDVGAGSGCFSIALALRHPHTRCTLLDLPAVCEIAASWVREYGLSNRITTLPANFFSDEWPRGHDAVLFSNILHDWGMPRCEYLLKQAFESLPSGGQVLVHEMLLGDDGSDLAASCLSLQMVAGTQGKQFTPGELEALLICSGFEDIRFTHTFTYFWTASAHKP